MFTKGVNKKPLRSGNWLFTYCHCLFTFKISTFLKASLIFFSHLKRLSWFNCQPRSVCSNFLNNLGPVDLDARPVHPPSFLAIHQHLVQTIVWSNGSQKKGERRIRTDLRSVRWGVFHNWRFKSPRKNPHEGICLFRASLTPIQFRLYQKQIIVSKYHLHLTIFYSESSVAQTAVLAPTITNAS